MFIAIIGLFGYNFVRHRVFGVTDEFRFDQPHDVPFVGAALVNLEATDIFVRRTRFDTKLNYWIAGRAKKENFERFVSPIIAGERNLVVKGNEWGIGHMNQIVKKLQSENRVPGRFSELDPMVLDISFTDQRGYRWMMSGAYNVSESKFVLDLHFLGSSN